MSTLYKVKIYCQETQLEKGGLAVIALNSGKHFADRICAEINTIMANEGLSYHLDLTSINEVRFANGELKVVINESVRGKDVYIVQQTDDPHSDQSINDNIFALAAAIDACFYSDARRITAVIPQFPYSRQDKKREREGISAKLVGRLLESVGANRVITLDIHSEAIEGFFSALKLENLHCGRLLIKYINENINMNNLVVVAPDVGSAKRALYFASNLKCDLAIIEKVRDYSQVSTISSMKLVGEVTGKDVFINDDMLATGGTLLSACKLLKENGAMNIYISISLPFFNNNAYEEFDKAFKEGLFTQVIGTDAVMWGEEFMAKYPWYIEITTAKLFANVITSINMGKSVSKLLS